MSSLNVLHLSYFKTGGAGRVAYLLDKKLQEEGVESKFLFKSEKDLRHNFKKYPFRAWLAVVDKWIVNKNIDHNFVSLFRNFGCNFSINKNIKKYKAIHLHWINGMISVKDIQKLINSDKKIFWTTHDSFPLTGGCHLLSGCPEFENKCRRCPIVRPIFRPLIRKQFERKIRLISNNPNFTLIFPSEFMKKNFETFCETYKIKCKKVINPISKNIYKINKENKNSDIVQIGFSAVNLIDRNKNLETLLMALEEVAKRKENNKFKLNLIGNGQIKKNLNYEIEHFGYVESEVEITKIKRNLDIWAQTSIFESFNLGVIESSKIGLSIVSSNTGIAPELIKNGINGFIFNDFDDLVTKLTKLVNDNELRKNFAQQMEKILKFKYLSKTKCFDMYR
jgi:glycosyltransferase involved in cell wall biosynthesis